MAIFLMHTYQQLPAHAQLQKRRELRGSNTSGPGVQILSSELEFDYYSCTQDIGWLGYFVHAVFAIIFLTG